MDDKLTKPVPWTEEEDKIIHEEWGKLTAKELGKILNRTRNAVIGRANRLKLRKGVATGPRKKPYHKEKPIDRRTTIFTQVTIVPRPPKVRTAMPKTDIPYVPSPDKMYRDGKGVHITALQNYHCRAIDDPKSLMFCGKDVKGGSSFCPHHHSIFFKPAPPIGVKTRGFDGRRGIRY